MASFFSNLKNIFDSNAVYRSKNGKFFRHDDLVKLVKKFDLDTNNQTIKHSAYNNLYRSNTVSNTLNIYGTRIDRNLIYNDYELMDRDPIISAALSIYADECVTRNEYGNIISIETEDEKLKEVLENLFYDVLNIESNLWPWIRNLCKYGDEVVKLDLVEKMGVVSAFAISPYSFQRIERGKQVAFQYVEAMDNTNNTEINKYTTQTLNPYECIHFRLISDTNFLPYGRSMVEGARKTWKQLILLEDAMLIHRIMRAPERRLFKVYVGNIKPEDVDTYMESIINSTKKTPYIDESTGDYDLRFNIMNAIEDFFIPFRGDGQSTEIDTLPALAYESIEDIEYVKNKMLAALVVPKAFLQFDESLHNRANLSSEDIRFSRTIERIQRVVSDELTKIAAIHLVTLGWDDTKIEDFEIKLTISSKVAEQERVELLSSKNNLARDLMETGLFSSTWIYDNIFNISKDDQDILRAEIEKDKKRKWRNDQFEQNGKVESPENVESDEETPTEEPMEGKLHDNVNKFTKDKFKKYLLKYKKDTNKMLNEENIGI